MTFKKFFLPIFFLCVIFLIQLLPVSNLLSAHENYIDGEVIIKFKDTANDSVKKSIKDKHLLRTIRKIKRFNMHHLKLPAGGNVESFIEKLKKERHIEYAEPNYKRKPLTVIPDDSSWSQQWGIQKVSLPDAWGISTGSRNVVVALIDTGVDYNHPDLAGNIWNNTGEISGNDIDDDGYGKIDDVRGWNFYCPGNTDFESCDGDNNPMDTYGHGSHVAGIIGAAGNNGTGVAGTNWNVSIMPLRFMDDNGGVAAEVKAIDYAISMGAKIINASYGDTSFSRTEYDAIKHADEHGILFVAAAGNSTRDNDGFLKNYPASYSIANKIDKVVYPALPNIIAVAASKDDDALAYFSNYGATSVHLAAPGSSIYSTYLKDDRNDYQYAYKTMQGTSMATPFVTGTAALLLAQRPNATYTQIKEAILQSVDVIPSLSNKVLTGGRLNAYKAIQKINDFFVEIPLHEGWNFISTSNEPIDPSINIVLKDISPNVRIVWGYDNASKIWLKYKPDTQNTTSNTLDKIELGKGYWIYMDRPAVLVISRQISTVSPQSVMLYNGWNLIGYSGDVDAVNIDDEMVKIGDSWVVVWTWKDGQWYVKSSSQNSFPVQPLSVLNQKSAYWIKINPRSRQVEWVQ